MSGNEVNKIAGAILGMATLAMGIGFFSGALVSPKPIVKAGYELPDDSGAASGGAVAAAEEKAEPIAKRLASADVKKGETSIKKCVSCHSLTPDGKNGTGPGLYGVVMREKGKHEGFKYSAGMTAKGGAWDYEALDAFIAKPKDYVSGTSMGFAGVPRGDERANIIAYLRSLSGNPAPLPQ
ncbi:MAG TPA: cytochrome c family protein [Rhabdaerophilum sp.]|nr:cytochrome c family protein [Rhabdaerophilum sp.]